MVLAASSAGLSLTAFVDKCNPPTVWATQHNTWNRGGSYQNLLLGGCDCIAFPA